MLYASQKVPERSGRLRHQEVWASRLGWPGTNFLGSVLEPLASEDAVMSRELDFLVDVNDKFVYSMAIVVFWIVLLLSR